MTIYFGFNVFRHAEEPLRRGVSKHARRRGVLSSIRPHRPPPITLARACRPGAPARRRRLRNIPSACCAGFGWRCQGCWPHGCGCPGNETGCPRIRRCSTSATVWPTKARAAMSAACTARLTACGRPDRRAVPWAGRRAGGWRCPRSPAPRRAAPRGAWRSPARGRCPGQRWAAKRRRASADSGRSGKALAAAYFLTKCSASAATSAGRSRKAGSRRFTTFRRYNRSSRKTPSRTAAVKSRLDVARMRISTLTGLEPPTRSISRS